MTICSPVIFLVFQCLTILRVLAIFQLPGDFSDFSVEILSYALNLFGFCIVSESCRNCFILTQISVLRFFS